jgi:hypothetical protein
VYKLEKEYVMQDKNRVINVLYRWIRFNQSGQSIEKLLLDKGFYNIAVYSFTPVSKSLIYELDGSQVNIAYLIDRYGSTLHINFKCCTLEEADSNGIDAVICCYIGDDKVVEDIKKYFSCPVLTMEEVLYEL